MVDVYDLIAINSLIGLSDDGDKEIKESNDHEKSLRNPNDPDDVNEKQRQVGRIFKGLSLLYPELVVGRRKITD